jgi:membrane protein
MDALVKIENWIISKLKFHGGGSLHTAIVTYTDYRYRHLNEPAASISFYAIFSVFPLMAFSAYLVGEITGKGDTQSAAMVIKILTDFVPGMQHWIQDGLFNIVKGKSVNNWINAALLAWAAHGFFHAANSAINKIPNLHKPHHRSYIENTLLAALTLVLFAGLLAAVIYTEYLSSANVTPLWMIPIKNAMLQNFMLTVIQSGVFLGCTAVLATAALYYILIPYALRFRYALLGGALFSVLLITSRAGYWIYLHYNKGTIESVYGIFSALMLIMLWVHFVSNCFVFSCLYAYHLDKFSAEHPTGTIDIHRAA